MRRVRYFEVPCREITKKMTLLFSVRRLPAQRSLATPQTRNRDDTVDTRDSTQTPGLRGEDPSASERRGALIVEREALSETTTEEVQ